MVVGNIQSRTALRLIREWASLHRRELETNWKKMKAGRPLERIEPLPCGGYRIHVTFNDNSEKTIDFREWLKGPVFEPLKAPNRFRSFFLDGGTVAWPSGADIAPETLYEYYESGKRPERGR
jgi:hypothetical protein